MTTDDILRMAREAGLLIPTYRDHVTHLERFAALVLEEAAKAAETQLDEAEEARADKAFKDADFVGNPNDALSKGKHWMTVSTCNAVARNCVDAIRSLKPKGEA